MTVLEFSIILFLVAYLAGFLGSLTGLGGGIIIVPILVLLFKIDIRYAMGASLIAVITTSSGAALAFIKNHYTNIKIGMLLETSAIFGAIIGALLVRVIPVEFVSVIFGVVLIFAVWFSLKRHKDHLLTKPSHPWALRLGLGGDYQVRHVPLGLGLMTIAGALSGLLGIGSGALKVLAMDLAMNLPYKVSTSTSNFMIGMTGAASVGIYFSSGYINPELSFPIIPGVFLGSVMGSKILLFANVRILKIIFSVVILMLSVQMIYKGISGSL